MDDLNGLKVITITYSAWTKGGEMDENCKYSLITDADHAATLLWEIKDEYGLQWDELERLLWYIEYLRGREYVSSSIKSTQVESIVESIGGTCDDLLATLEAMKGDEEG